MVAINKYVNQLNFDEFSKINLNEESLGGGISRVQIASPYSTFDEDSNFINNFDKINRHLTPYLSTKGSDGSSYLTSYDDRYTTRRQSVQSLGAFDRFFWAGEINSSNNFIFKPTDYNIGAGTIGTDGYCMIPSPNIGVQQCGSRIKLKFNNLPANTFVPLCGMVYNESNDYGTASNNLGSYYRTRHRYYLTTQVNNSWGIGGGHGIKMPYLTYGYETKPHGAAFPLAFSSNTANIYGQNTNSYKVYAHDIYGDYTQNTLVWFLYAHDGNGNAMIAMCGGDSSGTNNATDQFNPYNKNYGDTDAQGTTKFEAPKFLTDYLSDPNNSLQTLYDTYKAGARNLGDERDSINFITRYKCSNAASYFHSHDTHYDFWQHSAAVRDNSYGADLRISGGAPYHIGRINHLNMQILAYGPTTNADLSNVSEFLIHSNVSEFSNRSINAVGISPYRQTSYSNTASQIFYTGKIGDLKFRDVHGQCLLNTAYDRGRYWLNGQTLYTGLHFYYGAIKSCSLVLRPTYNEQGEIHSVIMSNSSANAFSNTGHDTSLGTTEQYYPVDDSTSTYVFGKFDETAFLLDGLSGTKSNSGSDIVDASSSWNNEPNILIDNQDSVDLTSFGSDKPLVIPISEIPSFTGNASDYSVTQLSIVLKGITAKSFASYELKAGIFDSNDSIIFESSQSYTSELDDKHSNIKVGSFAKFIQYPLSGDSIRLLFESTTANPVTYDDLIGSSLKIWVEKS